MSGTRICILPALMVALSLGSACSNWDACGDEYCLEVGPPQRADGVGAAQGLDVRDDLIWIIGDGQTGVARAFQLDSNDHLSDTERRVALTVNGIDRLPHPTGLTYQAGIGTYIGNTVNERGEILFLDWNAAVADGSLDHAILNATRDDAAVNGSRPELVFAGGRWLVASADYGTDRNQLRLYDPDFLPTAGNTTDPNVLVAHIPAPPYVQSLHYWADRDVLVLVQNRHSGTGWLLTLVDLEQSLERGSLAVVDVLRPGPPGELEGFHFVDGERAVMVTSAQRDNAFVVTLKPRA